MALSIDEEVFWNQIADKLDSEGVKLVDDETLPTVMRAIELARDIGYQTGYDAGLADGGYTQ